MCEAMHNSGGSCRTVQKGVRTGGVKAGTIAAAGCSYGGICRACIIRCWFWADVLHLHHTCHVLSPSQTNPVPQPGVAKPLQGNANKVRWKA